MKAGKLILLAIAYLCMTISVCADDSSATPSPAENSGAMPVDANQGKAFSVDCYKENPDNGLNLGTLTVTSPTEAGPACNATFYDCQDKCYGCFPGPAGQTCTDNSGSTLKR